MAADPPQSINWNQRLMQTANSLAAQRLAAQQGKHPYHEHYSYRFGQVQATPGEMISGIAHTKVAMSGIATNKPEISKSSYYDTHPDLRRLNMSGLTSLPGMFSRNGGNFPPGEEQPANTPSGPPEGTQGSEAEPPPAYVFSRPNGDMHPPALSMAEELPSDSTMPSGPTVAPPVRTIPSQTPSWVGGDTSSSTPWTTGSAIKANRPQYQDM